MIKLMAWAAMVAQAAPAAPMFESAHQQQIQDNIDDAGNGDENQRMLGIPHSPQNSADRVVSHDKKRAAHADIEVSQGFVEGLGRGVHPPQDGRAQQEHHDSDDRPADGIKGEHGAHRLGNLLLPFGADILGDEYGASHRQAADEVDDQNGHLPAHADGGSPHRAVEPADDEHVGHVVQRLQQVGCQKRQGKQQKLLGHAALGQIVLKFTQTLTSTSRREPPPPFHHIPTADKRQFMRVTCKNSCYSQVFDTKPFLNGFVQQAFSSNKGVPRLPEEIVVVYSIIG